MVAELVGKSVYRQLAKMSSVVQYCMKLMVVDLVGKSVYRQLAKMSSVVQYCMEDGG